MKVFAVLLSLASVAVASVVYTEPGVRPGPGGVIGTLPIVPNGHQPGLHGGTATGAAGGNLAQAQHTDSHGTSQVQILSSGAEGSAANGGSSFNRGSSRGSQFTGPSGSGQDGSTSGISIQQGGRPGNVIGTHRIVPNGHQPGRHGGTATGAAGGSLVQGQFTGSSNRGSPRASQFTGPHGSHQTGGTSGTSIQHGGRPGNVIGTHRIVPNGHQPGQHGGTATGAAGGDLVQGQFTGSSNRGSPRASQFTGPHGSHQTGGTSGTSVQHGGRPGNVIGTNRIVPNSHQPGRHGGTATGAAGGDLVQGQFTDSHGTFQTQQLSAGAKGTAMDGGSSFNRGSSHGSQFTGAHGSHQTGSTSGTSIQQGGGFDVVVPAHQPAGGLNGYQ